MSHDFGRLESDIREVLKTHGDSYPAIVEGVKPLLADLLRSETLLPQEYLVPRSDKYAQYLLYKPDDEAFAVVAFVWAPGQTAPVHDHLVWGLVGIWRGAVEEVRYRRIDLGEGAEPRFQLEPAKTIKAERGDISFVYPPDYDIHGVSNPYGEVAVTVHIYGTDIGKQPRHIHDPATGAARDVVTAHDNAEAIYPH